MAKNIVAATATAGVVLLSALLLVYGVSLITPGMEYAGATTSMSFDSSGVMTQPDTATYTTYEPTVWGLAPIVLALAIALGALVRVWPMAFATLAIMTGFGFLTAFSIGGPIFVVALLMWMLLPIAFVTRRRDDDFSASLRARWDRLTKVAP